MVLLWAERGSGSSNGRRPDGLLANGGWAEEVLGSPPKDVTRQMRRVVLTLADRRVRAAPARKALLTEGLIAPGRPADRGLGAGEAADSGVRADLLGPGLPAAPVDLAAAGTGWPKTRTGSAGWVGIAGPLASGDRWWRWAWSWCSTAAGFRFTARRLTFGGALTMILAGAAWGTYRLLLRLIADQSWRWKKSPSDPRNPSARPTGQSPNADRRTDGSRRRCQAPDPGEGRGLALLSCLRPGMRSGMSTSPSSRYISEQPIGLARR